MRHHPLLRVLACTLALATGFAGPATTLVHALQHGDANSTAWHAVSTSAHHHDDEPHAPASPTSSEEHPHPRLDAGHAPRTIVHLSPVLVAAVAAWAPALAIAVTVDTPVDPLSVVITTTGPPPSTRAPPAI